MNVQDECASCSYVKVVRRKCQYALVRRDSIENSTLNYAVEDEQIETTASQKVSNKYDPAIRVTYTLAARGRAKHRDLEIIRKIWKLVQNAFVAEQDLDTETY